MRKYLILFVVLLFSAAPSHSRGVPPAPDLVLLRGKILTVDRRFSVAEAVAIRDDRIVAVGTNTAIRRLAKARTVIRDLGGRTVIPGLIDNHIHYSRAAAWGAYNTQIDGAVTHAQALETIAARARTLRPGEWVYVIGGWTEKQFSDAPGGFTTAELDAAAPNNPVFIQQMWTSFFLNTSAMKILAPQLGDLLSNGSPIRTAAAKGYDIQRAALRYAPANGTNGPGLTSGDGVTAFSGTLNAMGLTTVYDMDIQDDTHRVIADLGRSGKLTLRTFWSLNYPNVTAADIPAAIAALRTKRPLTHNLWTGVIGIGELVYKPIHDTPGRMEIADKEWPEFAKIAEAAAQYRWPMQQHLLGRSVPRFLDIAEGINRKHPLASYRWTIAHANEMSMDDIARAKRLGIAVAMHGVVMFPPQLGSPPARSALAAGVPVGLGSDGTLVTANPFLIMWGYVTGNRLPNQHMTDETISREQALTAYTRTNAWLLFMERDLGSIEPGKLADLVILDRDFMTVAEDDIRNIKPVATIVGGRSVFGSLTDLAARR